jgi:hypothetical protein
MANPHIHILSQSAITIMWPMVISAGYIVTWAAKVVTLVARMVIQAEAEIKSEQMGINMPTTEE